jgi:hypothetical protein
MLLGRSGGKRLRGRGRAARRWCGWWFRGAARTKAATIRGEFSAEGGACGLKASAQKKRVRGDGAFGGADFVVRIERGEAESGVFEGGAVCAADEFVQQEPAEEDGDEGIAVFSQPRHE